MKKGLKRRIIACMVIVALLLGSIGTLPASAMSRSDYDSKVNGFINDARWRSGVSWAGGKMPSLAKFQSWGCCAYVSDFAKYVYGYDNPCSGSKFWGSASQIQTGDILHIYNGTYGEHWIAVLGRNGNSLYTAEGNYGSRTNVSNSAYSISGAGLKASWGGAYTLTEGWHYNIDDRPPTPNCSLKTSEKLELGEKHVTFSANPADANVSVHPVNGQTVTQKGAVTVIADKTTTYSVTVSRGGYNTHTSAYTVTVPQTPDPVVSVAEQLGGNLVTITCSNPNAAVFYEIDGVTNEYSAPFAVNEDCTLKAYAIAYGGSQSNVVSRLIEKPVLKPVCPTVSKTKIAAGDSVTVSWTKSSQAKQYTAMLKDENGIVLSRYKTVGCAAVFTLENPGDYSVVVTAANDEDSKDSDAIQITAMPDVTAYFYIPEESGEKTLFQSYTVRYGYDAEYPSQAPVRRGYTFNGWTGGNLTAMTEDQEFTAAFTVNYYTVSFYDYAGNRISSDSYPYGSAAAEPEIPACREGFVFAGWAVTEAQENDSKCDWSFVDSDMKIQAVQCWQDATLPVIAAITEAEYESAESKYCVKVNLNSDPDAASRVSIVRVALKSRQGQMVKTVSREVVLAGNDSQTVIFEIPCSSIVYNAEVYVLERDSDTDKTGGVFAQAASKEVHNPSNYTWADWTTKSAVESETLQVESKTQYAYKDKIYTTSASSSLSGWIQYDSSSVWGGYGDWSGWQTTAVVASDYR